MRKERGNILKYQKWFRPISKDYFASLDNARTSHEGRASFPSSVAADAQIALISAIQDFDQYDIPTLKKAVRQALFSRTETLEAKSWLAEVSQIYWKAANNTSTKYVVFTGVFLSEGLPFHAKTVNGCRITPVKTPYSDRNKRFLNSHQALIATHFKDEKENPSRTPDQWVKVHVCAQNNKIAYYKARNALDELRGLLNFIFNRTKISRRSFNHMTPQPLNDVAGARYASVHNPNGSIVDDNLWYQRHWQPPKKRRNLGENDGFPKRNFEQCLLRLQAGHPLAERIKRALRLYCRALDNPNFKEAFLELWAVLEILSLIEPGDKHERVVKRVASVFENTITPIMYLHHMREMRNAMIHTGLELEDEHLELLMYQLNRDVCTFMNYLICNTLKFNSESEARAFFDADQDNTSLQDQIRLNNKVLKFRNS